MKSNSSVEITVLVTGVGAIIGQGIVKSLKASRFNVRVIGIDKKTECYGQALCDLYLCKPEVSEDSAEYLEFWERVLEQKQVNLVIPGLEVDVDFLVQNIERMNKYGAKFVLNNGDLIDLCNDKLKFYNHYCHSSFEHIPTIEPVSFDTCIQLFEGQDFLFKPKRGNGGRGIVRIEDSVDFNYWLTKATADVIAQPVIGSDEDEYTVATFGDGLGNIGPIITFRRLLSAMGHTEFAELVFEAEIEFAVQALCKYYKPEGPTNFQFRKFNNKLYLLEINPRFSSSTSVRSILGYNEAEMCIQYYLFDQFDFRVELKSGRVYRYNEDWLVS